MPIAREIVESYVEQGVKFPWYIDLLNINLNNNNLNEAKERIRRYMSAFTKDGTRVTENLDFTSTNGPTVTSENELGRIDEEIADLKDYFANPRFQEITRLYSARQVVAQRGTIRNDYTVARTAAEGFYRRLPFRSRGSR